jgi:hypothetical protein
MKTSFLPQMIIGRSCRVGAFACLTFLLASVTCAHAQLTFNGGFLNIWWNDGNGTTYHTDPYSPQETLNGPGTALSTAGQAWLIGGTTAVPGTMSAFATYPYTYNSFSSSAFGSAVVNWDPATLVSGGTNFGGSFVGTSITLNNTSSQVAEVRLDWTAYYQNNTGNTLTLPISIYANFAGSYTTFASVSAQLFYDDPSTTSGTANIGINPAAGGPGDWTSSLGYPSQLSTYAPHGAFFGYDLASHSPYYTYIGDFAPGITVNSGDTVTVIGYLDVLVDPGTVQLVFQAGPHLDIATVGNLPVVSWPAVYTNFVLESATRAFQQIV